MRGRGVYRANVWRDQILPGRPWLVGVWKLGGPLQSPPAWCRIAYRTHQEALAAGLAWAGELNAREAAER